MGAVIVFFHTGVRPGPSSPATEQHCFFFFLSVFFFTAWTLTVVSSFLPLKMVSGLSILIKVRMLAQPVVKAGVTLGYGVRRGQMFCYRSLNHRRCCVNDRSTSRNRTVVDLPAIGFIVFLFVNPLES